MRILSIILLIPLALIGLPLTIPAVMLIVQAEVEASRFFAAGFLLLYFTLLCALKHLLTVEGRPMLWGSLSAVAAGCFLYASYSQAPRGITTEENPHFESVFLKNASYPVFHPANFIAEIDQLKTGYTILRHLESLTSGGKGGNGKHIAQMKPALVESYKELRYLAQEFNDYGSSMYSAYSEALGWKSDSQHLYVYLPPAADSRPAQLPILLLLHGHYGNYKGNLWALKSVADEMGFAIVAPTHGLGNWGSDAGSNVLQRTLEYCRDRVELDVRNVYLVGMGEGAKGLSRFGRELPNSFRGLVSIAGVLDGKSMDSIEFLPHWKDRPVLVIHGSEDPRMTPPMVEAAVLPLKQGGVRVVFNIIDDADQYLIWTHDEEVAPMIKAWLQTYR